MNSNPRVLTLLLLVLVVKVFSQPAILSHPSDTSVCSGVTVHFTITASNAAVYQWQEYDGTGWFEIGDEVTYAEGENTETLVLNDVIIGLNDYQYRCYVEDAIGESVVSNSATLNVYAPPLIQAHPQDLEVCKNETATFTVMVQNVTDYQWQENRGSGWYDLMDNSFYEGAATNELKIFTIFGINDYQYRCKVYNNACYEISDEALLHVNPLPQVFFVYGGGEICENTTGLDIYLNDSEAGVNYELIRDDELTVAVREGTGEEINFGSYAIQGTYTVRAVNATTACINTMSGSAVISVIPAPESYDLVSTGVFCEGSTGTTIFLQSSEVGVVYALLLNGNPLGYQLEGTGGMLSFINISTAGSYSVRAENTLSGCSGFMNNTIEMVGASSPQIFTLSGSNVYCEGQNGVDFELSGSELSVQYILLIDGLPEGQTLMGTEDPLVFGDITTAGEYTVRAVHQDTECESMMNGTILLSTAPSPSVYTVSGDDYICEGDYGALLLSGSEEDILYEVYQNNVPTGNILAGNGDPLTFQIAEDGVYQIYAYNPISGCSKIMSGQGIVQVKPVPVANAGSDKEIESGTSTVLDGFATGGTGSYLYQWQPADMLQNATLQQPLTVNLSEPVLFALYVEDGVSGCISDPDTVYVTIENGSFLVQAYASNEAVCQGDNVYLYALVQGGSGNYDYYWYTEDGEYSSTELNPTIVPDETEEYIVRVDDGNTTVEDTVTIIVNETPEIYSLTGDNGFCGGSTEAELTLSGFQSDVTYQLYRNGLPTNVTPQEQVFYVGQEGTYTLQASRQGCEADMEGYVVVEEFESPIIDAGADQYIYQGNTVQLNGTVTGGSGIYVYGWLPEYFIDNPYQEDPLTNPIYSTVDFILTAVDNETGCPAIPDTMSAIVSGESLTLNLQAQPESVCPGSAVQLSVLTTGGDGELSYSWSSSPAGFASNQSNATAYPEEDTWYYVTVSDNNNSVVDSVWVATSQMPVIQYVNGGGGICENSPGEEITLSDSEIDVYYSLYNQQGELINAVSGDGDDISLGLIQQEGSYQVIATHTESACSVTMNGQPIIYHFETPTAFAGENQVVDFNTVATLNGYGTGGSGQYSYFWMPSASVQNATNPTTETINLTSSALFQLLVTDEISGCTSEADSVLITVGGSNLSVILQSSASTVCRGESVQLLALASGGTGYYTYDWEVLPSGLENGSYVYSHIPEVTSTYTVTVSDGVSTVNKSVQVVVEESPTVFAGNDQTIFFGESATLLGEAGGGSGNYAYQWEPNGLLNGLGTTYNVTTVSLYNDVDYRFQVVDLTSGCASEKDTTHVNVVGNDLEVQAIASAEELCGGAEVTFSSLISGGEPDTYSISWSSVPSGYTSDQPEFTAQLLESIWFYVTVQDGIGEATDSVYVSVTPSPDLFIITGNEYYCDGEDGTELALNDSQEEMTYQLLRDNIFYGSQYEGTGSAISFGLISQEGFYSVLAINNTNSCSRTMSGSKQVEQAGLPFAFDLLGNENNCEGSQMVLNQSGSEIGVRYTLFQDDEWQEEAMGTGDNILYQQTASDGLFRIVGQDTLSGCATEMSNTLTVNVNPVPAITLSNDTTILNGASVILSATGASSYIWNTEPVSQQAFVEVSPDETTLYFVTGTNIYGCQSIDSVLVTVDMTELSEVNAFTPNDDGVNDVFRVGFQITVFNRWGNILYEGAEGWNGKYNGEYVPAGTYFYVQQTDAAGNAIDPLKRSVTVVRKND